MTTHLHLDSKYKTLGTDGNYVIQFDTGIEDVSSLKLESVSIPYSWYEFSTGANTIVFEDTVNPSATITIEPGNYTTFELVSEINTKLALTAAPYSGITISYDGNNYKFTFSALFTYVPTYPAAIVAKKLGFTSVIPLAATTHTSTNIARLQEDYLYIRSNYLGSGRLFQDIINSDTKVNNIIGKIPINVNPGNIIQWNNESLMFMIDYMSERTLNEVDLTLVNGAGQALDLNGGTWSCTFSLR